MNLAALETPALVLDARKMHRNIVRMKQHLDGLGVALRPHLKTAKNVDVARALVAGQPGGITVSTLHEADYFADAGFTDILYAVGITPNKLAHAGRLIQRGVALTLILDSMAAATSAADFAERAGINLPFLLEIDCDGHRSGLAPTDPALMDIAAYVEASPVLTLRGVMTHAGGAYDAKSEGEIVAAAENERATLVDVAQALRAAGAACPVVSVGSSPTAWFGKRFDGVTEVRAGVYVFGDLMMANLGVAGLDDIALSVVTTVVAHRPEHGWIITDSGWTALSPDQGTHGQRIDYGFGQVCTLDGAPIEGMTVVGTNQEHGIIAMRDGGIMLDRYPVGTMLRVLPVHACATAAAHRRYQVVEGGTEIVSTWERINGW